MASRGPASSRSVTRRRDAGALIEPALHRAVEDPVLRTMESAFKQVFAAIDRSGVDDSRFRRSVSKFDDLSGSTSCVSANPSSSKRLTEPNFAAAPNWSTRSWKSLV